MTREQQIAAEVAARYGCPVPDTAVQVLPVGKSAWQAPFWDPTINRLRYPDAEARQRAAHAEHYILGRNVASARAAEARAARRAEVARLHSEGVWSSEIARRLDVCPTTVSDDLAALGLNPVKPPPGLRRRKAPHVVAPEIIARNARIAELAALGWSSEQIGQAVGFTRQTVNAVAAKLGIEIKRRERPSLRRARAVVAREERAAAEIARRAEVRKMIEAGQLTRDIADRLGVTPRTVARDATALGLNLVDGRSLRKPRSQTMVEMHEERETRRDLVVRLHARGLKTSEIAASIGMTARTVRHDLHARGVRFADPQGAVVLARARREAQVAATIAARDAKLRQFIAEGLGRAEMRAALGVKENTLRKDLARLGGLRVPDDAAIKRRRAEVARMRSAGKTLAEIRAALGISSSTLTLDIRAVGLVGGKNVKAERQMRVMQMRSEGATLQKMVEALGVSASTISADITELGLARSNNNQKGVAA